MASTTDLGKWMLTNGGEYNPETAYEQLTMVMYENSTYITLKTVQGITPTDDHINYQLMAKGFNPTALESVQAEDTSGVLGEVGGTVSAQDLINWVVDQAATKLLKISDLVSVQTNDATKGVSAALAYAMGQKLDQLNSDLIRNEVVSTTGVYLTRSGNVRLVKFISALANSDGLIVTMSNDKPNRRTFALVESMDVSGGSPVISRVDIRTDGAIYLTDLAGNALNKVALGEIVYVIA